MGKTVGFILNFGFIIFVIMGLKETSSYRPDVIPQIYFGAAFSCLVFGAICYELGKCACLLEKIASNKDVEAQKQIVEPEESQLSFEAPENATICKHCGKPVENGVERCPHCMWTLESNPMA